MKNCLSRVGGGVIVQMAVSSFELNETNNLIILMSQHFLEMLSILRELKLLGLSLQHRTIIRFSNKLMQVVS